MSLRENGKKIAVYAAQTLVQLLDTNIINKANGDILQYDSTTQKWKNQPTTFTEASSRANIDSGDSLSTIFGKIKKFFSDLKAVAFSGAYADLTGQPTNVSSFNNDSGYITSSGSCNYANSAGSATSATSAGSATKASILDGFGSGGAGNFTWGNQTGTGIWRNNDGGGGEFGFRKNNPSSGQVSMVIDGTVYVDEGRYAVIHAGNIGSQSVNYANNAGTVNGKTVGTNVPSNAVFTDTNNAVTQNNTGNDGNYYRILYSVTADDTTRTEGARKGRLLFKPSDVTLQGNDGSQRFLIGNGYMYLAGRSTIINTTSQHLYLRASSENNYGIYIGIQDNVWAVMPPGKDYMRLGTPNYRWNQIYSSNSAISTSDRKEKKDIVPLDESARTFVMALNPVSYKFKNGNSNRTHYGMIAQDVEDEMEALGMTALDFAGFCKDQKRDVRKVPTPYKDANGNTIFNDMQVDVPGEYTYALRYEEFIGPIIKTEQLQQEDINSLKEEVTLLKEEIALLKQRLQILEDK